MDLVPLGNLTNLVHLVLLENPVTRKENYRLFVVWQCPSVRYLDYERVKDAERKSAAKLFGTQEDPTPLAAEVWHTNQNCSVVLVRCWNLWDFGLLNIGII